MICQSFGLWAGFLLCSPPIHMNVWQVWAHTQIRTKYGLPVCCFFSSKNIEPITLVHGWISLHKLPTGKQMKAVWFPKVLTSPNSQQNSPKHGHREPLTLGHRSSRGPRFRWKSSEEEPQIQRIQHFRRRTTRLKPPRTFRLPSAFGFKFLPSQHLSILTQTQVNGPKSQAASQISVRNLWMNHPNDFWTIQIHRPRQTQGGARQGIRLLTLVSKWGSAWNTIRPSLPWCFPIRELPFEQKEQHFSALHCHGVFPSGSCQKEQQEQE